MTLVVDTPRGAPSHAEVLARAFWLHRKRATPRPSAAAAPPAAAVTGPRIVPPRRAVVPSAKAPTRPRVAVGPSRAAALAVLPSVSAACQAHVCTNWKWTDVEMHRAIRKFFPEKVLKDFALPPPEDLANDERVAAWRIWAQEEGVTPQPIQEQQRAVGWEALAVGKQRVATGSKHA